MHKLLTMGGVALVAALSVGLLPTTSQAGVTRTKDDCKTAWAVLTANNAQGQEAVKEVVAEHPSWSADGYEPMVSQKFALMVFDVVGSDDSVIVAHCGHGATCNQLAEEVEKKHADLHDPVIVCTVDSPTPLENGRAM